MKAVRDLASAARHAGVAQRTSMPTSTIGVVTDNADPDGLGRVLCKYPMISDELVGTWAPVVSMGAGPSSGWFFLPNVGDEVLVAFENNDINRPVVLGMLWSADRAPAHAAANPESTLLTIASQEQGARIEFDDDADEIRVFGPGGKTSMVLSKDGIVITTDGDVALTSMQGEAIIAGKAIEFAAQTSITATGMQESAIIGSSAVKITGKPSIQAAAPQLSFGGAMSGGSGDEQANDVIADPLS